jgi:hypothetical protein
MAKSAKAIGLSGKISPSGGLQYVYGAGFSMCADRI